MMDLVKRDANFITKNADSGFAGPVTFIDLDGVEYGPVNALHTKHHLGFDLQTAQEINTLKSHIDVSEQELIALGYPLRDVNNDIALAGHKVKALDSNGTEWTYIVEQWFPNHKVGVIVFILGRYEPY